MRSSELNPVRDWLEAAAVQIWRDQGYAASTISGYLLWIRRYRLHCYRRRLDDTERLTRRHAIRIAKIFAGKRCPKVRSEAWAIRATKTALRRWAEALHTLSIPVPSWCPPQRLGPIDGLLSEYCDFRRRWRTVKASSLRTETRQVRQFLSWLPRGQRQALSSLESSRIDGFLCWYGKTVKPKTLASVCSGLRSFLRFLHATGRTPMDLARCVEGPRLCKYGNPPRMLRWHDVRRILALIDRSTPTGKRDYAMFLLMAAYGMGASEILDLRLDDIDWRKGTVHVVRRKTGVRTLLPLLGPVGKALAAYLQGRPRHQKRRVLFLKALAPFPPLTFAGLTARWQRYSAAAGVSFRGTHALRHAHATRQVEAAAPPKVVSDILGHSDPSSLSTYARVATERLRAVCLPLP